MRPTRRSRRPASSAGAARTGLEGGGASSGASATATPRPGGRPTRPLAAGARPAVAAGGGDHRPEHLPGHGSWYLLTNLPRPRSRRAQQADLAEVVRLYGLRNWVEQGYKQVKGELGWADFQVRSDRAIRRHWALVCCAFSFCWQALLATQPTAQPAAPKSQAASPSAARGAKPIGHRRRTSQGLLAGGAAGGAGLADPVQRAAALLAVLVASAAAPAVPTAA
jgi:hypothetical protein